MSEFNNKCPECDEHLYIKSWAPEQGDSWPVCSDYGADVSDIDDSTPNEVLTRVHCIECEWKGTLLDIRAE
jgi:hypothetical protein